MNQIEQVQYNAALLVSGCWQGTNREKLYDELDGNLSVRWSRRMTIFYKILNGMPPYLLGHTPEHISSNVSSRRTDVMPPFPRTNRYDKFLSFLYMQLGQFR